MIIVSGRIYVAAGRRDAFLGIQKPSLRSFEGPARGRNSPETSTRRRLPPSRSFLRSGMIMAAYLRGVLPNNRLQRTVGCAARS